MTLRNAFALAITCLNIASAEFTLTAYLPDSPLNGQVINAAGEAFFLGLSGPAAYCPLTDQTQCPAGNQTVFAGMAALWVEVPGGQEIYITPEGALSFTVAHSESIPPGSFVGDFYNVTITSDCSVPVTVINWKAPNATEGGVLACPNVPSSENATYQIYTLTPGFNQTNCITLDGLLPTYLNDGDAFGAWEYT